jgi:hypothetical protein
MKWRINRLELLNSNGAPVSEPHCTEAAPDDCSTILVTSLLDPALLKPLKVGWRQELGVLNPTGDNQRRVDMYYWTLSGMKLHSLRRVSSILRALN